MSADADILRICDANLNRCREGLRVIEDYARFVLDDRDAAAAVKDCRHRVRALLDALGGTALLAARDIDGDVGRDTKTELELARTSSADVVRAAFVRLSEATRVLGEFGKLISPAAAAIAEELRYRGYELEQRSVLRGGLRRRFREVRLYVIITEEFCRRPWLETAQAAIRGGAGCLQLREKRLPDGELLRRARQLREITARHAVLLALNDRPDLARLAGADVVHVGQDDLSVRQARRIAGGEMLVGVSTHTLEQFEAARAQEPDYLAVGPMFPSESKPQAHLAGPETLHAARGKTELPLVAIGGITPANVHAIRAAGADCIAVCAAVSRADDAARAARELCDVR